MSVELKTIISRIILEQGPISFARFMELALYHKKYGYYMQNAEIFGTEGDFYTSSNVSEILGYTLAAHFIELYRELFSDVVIKIVEYGAGTGQLAYDILSYFHEQEVEADYRISEISPALIERQREKLASFKEVTWLATDDHKDEQINGIIFSNELIDALPFIRVVTRSGKLKEILVDFDKQNDVFIDNEMPASDQLLSYMNNYGVNLKDNQLAEININALNWMESATKMLTSGYLITIDYGQEATDLYSDSRPEGTAISFSNHKASTNLYDYIGEKDITSHVNFTAIIEHGKRIGLKKIYYNSQSKYLHDHGAIEILKEKIEILGSPVEKFKAQLNFKNLFLPQGMGERFKVLVQKK